jgi:hypothetical protein
MRRYFAAGCILLALVGLGACSSGDDEAKDFCKKYRTYQDADKALARSNLKNAKDLDLADVKHQVDKVAGQIDALDGTAPDEIASSVKKLRTKFDSFNEDVQAAKTPLDLVDATKAQGDVAKDPSVQKASDRVDTWTQDNCDSKGDTKS